MSKEEDRFVDSVISERLRAVHGVWTELAAGRLGPKRAELTPAKLRRATAWAFTVEVIDGGTDFRVGFRGDKVTQFMGEPCTAQSLASLRGIAFFDIAEALFRACVESRKPLVSAPRRTQYKGKEHLEREVLLLPLSEDGVTVTGLLGAFDTWQLGTHSRAAATAAAAD
ncbi:MAG: PAS domain-containing protein [Rhizomicrobium sp.]